MNFQEKLYNDLTQLIKNDEAFFAKDFFLEDRTYKIFNYRLASWTSFQAPGAMDARGIMFDVTDPSKVVLVSAPPQKFFNYEEGGVDHTKGKFGDKMVKMDGSLISSYIHNDQLYMKSKASLFSSQALDSMKFLTKEENKEFKDELTKLAKSGFTINLEYTSPENRIVIPYQKEELTVLSVRSNLDGQNYFASKLIKYLEKEGGYDTIVKNMVTFESLHGQEIDQIKYMEDVRKEQEGEGYVIEVVLSDTESYLTKGKNIKYIALHQTKDSVNSPKRLFESIIEEASDDLRSMFADDPYVLSKIKEMEDHVQPIFNHIVKTVEDFHAENKDLERKEYAIKATKEAPQFLGLLMNSYLNKPNNFKEFAKKVRKEMFGITDAEPELDDDGNPILKLKKKAP
jgi:T4 RnlA family RNA ligase